MIREAEIVVYNWERKKHSRKINGNLSTLPFIIALFGRRIVKYLVDELIS